MRSLDFKRKVLEYVEGAITLVELRDWYAPKLSLLLSDPDSPDAELVAAIELAHSELIDGLRTNEEARQYIKDAFNEYEPVVLETTTGTASVTPQSWDDWESVVTPAATAM